MDRFERGAVPAAAQAHNLAGAQAFVSFYMQQVNAAWTRPDGALLNGLASSECGTCANFVRVAKNLASEKQRYAGQVVSVEGLLPLPESATDKVYIQVLIRQRAQRVLDADGAVLRTTAKKAALSNVAVGWSSTGWLVTGIGIAPDE